MYVYVENQKNLYFILTRKPFFCILLAHCPPQFFSNEGLNNPLAGLEDDEAFEMDFDQPAEEELEEILPTIEDVSWTELYYSYGPGFKRFYRNNPLISPSDEAGPPPCCFLRPGASFVGTQFSLPRRPNTGWSTAHGAADASTPWNVRLTIHAADMAAGRLEGWMELDGVPLCPSRLVSYFEGFIVDNLHHTFFSAADLEASERAHLLHWRLLPYFPFIKDDVAKRGGRCQFLNSSPVVYFFLKERSFASPGASEYISIAGHYYAALDRRSGLLEAFYYNRDSGSSQRLSLTPQYCAPSGAERAATAAAATAATTAAVVAAGPQSPNAAAAWRESLPTDPDELEHLLMVMQSISGGRTHPGPDDDSDGEDPQPAPRVRPLPPVNAPAGLFFSTTAPGGDRPATATAGRWPAFVMPAQGVPAAAGVRAGLWGMHVRAQRSQRPPSHAAQGQPQGAAAAAAAGEALQNRIAEGCMFGSSSVR